jgi:hypothetical protein
MRRVFRAKYLASALAVSVVPYVASAIPASAQMYGDVSFDSFHDQLAQYGYWVYSDRWGLVWQPAEVGYDFRPYYSDGHWVYTDDYGWYWSSDYPWGDIAFHYGRWVDDPYDGWLWIPGYTWSPGWVIWRSNGEYIGWMPAPPDDAFLEGRGDVSFGLSLGFGGVTFNWNDDPYYGYRRWYGRDFDDRRFAENWVFIGTGDMADRDYRRVIVRDPVRVMSIIRQTRNVTNYKVVNNHVVNRSIDVRIVERAAGHPIEVAPARLVIRHPNLVMGIDASRRIQMREREIAPHGNGLANSAPPPSAGVVGKLSTQSPSRNGAPSQHLFTRSTVANPDVQSRFRGRPPAGQSGPGGTNWPGNMNGPVGPQGGPDYRRGEQGPRGEQGGVTGPNGPVGSNGPGGPGGMNGPGGNGPSDQGQDYRHRETGPQGAQPGGMNGPAGNGPGENGTGNQGQDYRHREQGPQPGGMNGPGGPGEMNGPGGAGPGGSGTDNAGSQMPRHRDQGSQSGPPGVMNGPGRAGGMNGPTGGGGMSGPGSNGSGPPPGTVHRTPPPAAGGAVTPPPPPAGQDQQPKPPKKKHPDDNPPGQPQ